MPYCYECGAACPPAAGGDPPICPDHGPLWKLRRNAPCADAVIVRDGRVLLARRNIEPFRGKWEMPGGFQNLGEHPADTVRREVKEELGLDVRLTAFLGFSVDVYQDGYALVALYEAAAPAGVDPPAAGGDGEAGEWRWFAPDELPPAEEMAWSHRRRLDEWRDGEAGRRRALGLDAP